VEQALQTIEDAETLDHPLTLAIALVWAVSVFLWVGDLDRAEEYIDRLFSQAEVHSLGPYLAVGRGFNGELAIRRGDASSAVDGLQRCLTELHAAPYELLTTPLNIALVKGLAATGRFAEAFALIEKTIRLVEANGDLCYLPETAARQGRPCPRSSAIRHRRGGTGFQASTRTQPPSGRTGVGTAHRDRPGRPSG
jgi:tetratricopeptide (TPR) repeat protein